MCLFIDWWLQGLTLWLWCLCYPYGGQSRTCGSQFAPNQVGHGIILRSSRLNAKYIYPLWWFEWEWPYRIPVNGTFREGLGSVVLLEEVWHWMWALRLQKPTPGPVSLFLPTACGSRHNSQLLFQYYACLLPALLPGMMRTDYPSKAVSKSPIKCFLL